MREPSTRLFAIAFTVLLVTASAGNITLLGTTAAANTSTTDVLSFEDGNIDGWNGDTGALTVTSDAIEGNHSAELVFANDSTSSVWANISSTTAPAYSFWWKAGATDDNELTFSWRNASGSVAFGIEVGAENDNRIVANPDYGNDGSGTVLYNSQQPGTWYQVRFYNVDFVNQTYDVALYAANGTKLATITGKSFMEPVAAVSQFRVRNAMNIQEASVHIDAVTVESTDSGPETLVVAKDGSGDYTSIQNAVENATDGDIVEVRPGTYSERNITIRGNITVTAPDGATLAGSGGKQTGVDVLINQSTSAFVIKANASPVIHGFTITNYRSAGLWAPESSVESQGEGAWKAENVVIRNTTVGVQAWGTDSDWTLQATRIENTTAAISAGSTSGGWKVHETNLYRNGFGVIAVGSSGRWEISGTTIAESGIGVIANGTSGNWAIRESEILASTNRSSIEFPMEGTGLYAVNTTGQWQVHQTRIAGNEQAGVNASNAAPAGNATHNWWGASDGPGGEFSGSGDAVVGNLTFRPFYTDSTLETLATDSTPGGYVDGFEDGEFTDLWSIRENESEAFGKVVSGPAYEGSHSLQLTTSGAGSDGDFAISRNFSGQINERAVFSAWIHPNSTNVKAAYILANYSTDASARLILEPFGDIRYRTDKLSDKQILVDSYNADQWYKVEMTVDPSNNTVSFAVEDTAGNRWSAAGIPATVDFSTINLRAGDYSGEETFHADAVTYKPRPTKLVVNKSNPDTYNSIQAAVDSAPAGATIEVHAGVYNESVQIDRSVDIVSETVQHTDTISGPGAPSDAPVLDSRHTRYAAFNIHENVTDVRIEGFKIQNYTHGIRAWNSGTADVTVQHNTIAQVNNGLLVGGDPTINDIGTGPHTGWHVASNVVRNMSDGGLQLENLVNATVRKNVINRGATASRGYNNFSFGIGLLANNETVRNVTVANNSVAGQYENAGIFVRAGFPPFDTAGTVRNVRVVNNKVTGKMPGDGIGVAAGNNSHATQIKVAHNTVWNATTEWPGIGVFTVENGHIGSVLVSQNTVVGNENGIGIDVAGHGSYDHVRVTENVVSNNDEHGVLVFEGTNGDGLSVHENRINGNQVAGLQHNGHHSVNATHNWWGSSSGPSGEFTGSGDAVRGNVTVTPFYTDSTMTNLASNVSRRLVVEVRPRETQVSANGTFTVHVAIDTNNQSVFGAQAALDFNTSLLTALDIEQGEFLSSDGANTTVYASMIDNQNGTIDYAETRQGTDVGDISGEGILFSATFRAANISIERMTALDLVGVNVSDVNLTPVEFTTTSGAVTIASNQPPSVNATLLTSVNNVGSPIRIAVNASDTDGQVEIVRLESPSGETISEKSCSAGNCTVEFSPSPPRSTWTEGEYQTVSLDAVAEDGIGAASSDSVTTAIFIAGDATGNGKVDIFDAVTVGRSWHTNRTDAAYSDAADLNNDGEIDIRDAVIIGQNWRNTADNRAA